MNQQQNHLTKIADIINKSMTGSVILPPNPSIDAAAAATSLYLGLSKMGKTIYLACSSPVNSDLQAADKITDKVVSGGDSLVISFPYMDGAIEKIDYNIQENIFNLVITPRPGQPKLDPQKVNYSYSGGAVDFIITVDAPTLNSLGALYSNNQKDFQNKTIINIDRHLVNDFYGTVNYINKISSSTSELVFTVLQTLQSNFDKDIATNLYSGITAATNNFTSYSVNADTFETAAKLLKLGALKKAPARPSPASFGQQPFNGGKQTFIRQTPQPYKPKPPHSSFPPHREQPPPEKNVENIEDEVAQEEPVTPQDWLKPKIMRGSGLL